MRFIQTLTAVLAPFITILPNQTDAYWHPLSSHGGCHFLAGCTLLSNLTPYTMLYTPSLHAIGVETQASAIQNEHAWANQVFINNANTNLSTSDNNTSTSNSVFDLSKRDLDAHPRTCTVWNWPGWNTEFRQSTHCAPISLPPQSYIGGPLKEHPYSRRCAPHLALRAEVQGAERLRGQGGCAPGMEKVEVAAFTFVDPRLPGGVYHVERGAGERVRGGVWTDARVGQEVVCRAGKVGDVPICRGTLL